MFWLLKNIIRIEVQVIFILTISSFLANGQIINADSLYNVWMNQNIDEKERVAAFFGRFRQVNIPISAIRKWAVHVDEAIEIAERHQMDEYLGGFYVLKGGAILNFKGQFELGCRFFKDGLSIAEEQQDYFIMMAAIPYIHGAKCPYWSFDRLIQLMEKIKPSIGNHKVLYDWTHTMLLKAEYGYDDSLCHKFHSIFDQVIVEQEYSIAFLALREIILANCIEFDFDKLEYLENGLTGNKRDVQETITQLRNMYYDLEFVLRNSNRFPEALKIAQKLKGLSEEYNIVDNIYYSSLAGLGQIHYHIGNIRESEKYLLQALKIAKYINDLNAIGESHMAISKLYLNRNEIQLAETHLDSAIHIMRDKRECESCYTFARITKAGVYNFKGNHDLALKELNEIKNRFVGPGNGNDDHGRFFIELGKAYTGIGQLRSAQEAVNEGLNKNNIFLSTISELNQLSYQLQERQGNYEEALSFYKTFVILQDSVAKLRSSEEVTRLELENQYAQQRLSDSLQVEQQRLAADLAFQKQLSKQKATRNLFLALGLAAILAAIGLWYRLKYIRRTQQIIQREKEKAQASERAKHQFLANMSHEIRTPMNAIKGMTDILIRRNPRDEQLEYLNGIKQSSDSLLVIINDILDISKIEEGKIELEREPFSINSLVDNLHALMQFKAEEKGLELVKNIPENNLMVIGDEIRLRQILINLIGNAIKFTEKGMVTTRIESTQIQNTLNVHFTVADTGIGIDADRIDQIFDSFQQAYSDTSRKFGGTGLGLSISKRLVELHNGKIWVESEKGRGSQFHFTISYQIAESVVNEEIYKKDGDSISADLKGIKVLLVEDNQFNAIVAQEELEDTIEDVQVVLAENGMIAVEKLKAGNFDVILMDVQMPKMNGYEATQRIRAFNNGKSRIPIIAMTANVLKEEVDKCFEAGMDDFIGKPFNTNDLIGKMDRLVKLKLEEKDL